ncbi:MAG TPA: hypothetical protein VJS64_12250 [Pyrinomonadaceae bacterium]|nr:hypothetical protein [Pyrinomonadaceae bacterium]
MRINRKQNAVTVSIILMLLSLPGIGAGQAPKSIVASAKGEGVIKMGDEEFKIQSVVVKLFEDGKAEIQVVSDITAFVSGTWSRADDASKSIDIKITGNMMSEGGGTLLVGEDRKSIAELHLKVVNKASKKMITADFVAK